MYEIGLSGDIRRDPAFIRHLEMGLQNLIEESADLEDVSINIRENHSHAFLAKMRAHFTHFDYTVTGIGENEFEAFESARELLLDWISKMPVAETQSASLANPQGA